MTRYIDPEVLSLYELIKAHCFAIPDYQRDFVWKDEQVKALWTDLISHHRANVIDGEERPNSERYFLGSMVTVRAEDAIQSMHAVSVVDGQQRLTCLTTLIAVLRDAVVALSGESQAAKDDLNVVRQQLDQMKGDVVGDRIVPKVIPPEKDVRDFMAKVCADIDSMADRRIYWENDPFAYKVVKHHTAAQRIKKAIEIGHECLEGFLSEVSSVPRHRRLKLLIGTLCRDFCVLLIKTHSTGTAYVLFESLNNRGLPLTQADLIKNEVIKLAKNESDREEVLSNWAAATKAIRDNKAISFPELLHLSHLSRYSKGKSSRLFVETSTLLKKSSVPPKSYSARVRADAEAIQVIAESHDGLDETETQNALVDCCDVLGAKMAFVPIMRAYDQYVASEDSEGSFCALVKLINNFVFRHMKVCRGDLSVLTDAMYDSAELIRKRSSLFEVAAKLRTYNSDDEFVRAFESYSIGANAKLGYYVVYNIERLMLKGTLPLEHGMESNLEHIMPQKPKKKDWPHAFESLERNRDEYRRLIWMVGNLIPLPHDINKSIKAKPFAFKLKNETGKCYSSCDLKSWKTLSEFCEKDMTWTSNSIHKRQKKIALELALQAWPLDAGSA